MRRPQWCVLEWIVHSQLPYNGKVDISQTQHRMVANLRQSALVKEMQQVIDNRKMFVALPVPISAFNKGHVVEYSLLPPVEWYKPLRKFESLFIVITHSPRPMYFFCDILLEQGFRVTSHWRGLHFFSRSWRCCLGLSAYVEHVSCLHIPRSTTSKAFLGWLVKEKQRIQCAFEIMRHAANFLHCSCLLLFWLWLNVPVDDPLKCSFQVICLLIETFVNCAWEQCGGIFSFIQTFLQSHFCREWALEHIQYDVELVIHPEHARWLPRGNLGAFP